MVEDFTTGFTAVRLLVVSGVLALAGCTTYQPPSEPSGVWLDAQGRVVPEDAGEADPRRPSPEDMVPQKRAPYTLQVGDSLEIRVEHESTPTPYLATIGPDGQLALPLIGLAQARGLSLAQIRKSVESRYDRYLVGARVIVSLREYKIPTCTVLGQLKSPGQVRLETPKTLMDVVAEAGGFTSLTASGDSAGADISRAFIARHGRLVAVDFKALFLEGDLRQNCIMRPGDFLYVPDLADRSVTVVGRVRKGGTFQIGPTGLSVLSAIGLAGGFENLASLTNLAVVRDVTSAPKVRIVNVERILAAKERDFELEAGDVIFVPRDDLRSWNVPDIIRTAASSLFLGLTVTPILRNSD